MRFSFSIILVWSCLLFVGKKVECQPILSPDHQWQFSTNRINSSTTYGVVNTLGYWQSNYQTLDTNGNTFPNRYGVILAGSAGINLLNFGGTFEDEIVNGTVVGSFTIQIASALICCSSPSTGEYAPIFSFMTNSSKGFFFGLDDSSSLVYAHNYGEGSTFVSTGISLLQDQWMDFSFVINAVTKNISVYEAGFLFTTISIPSYPNNSTFYNIGAFLPTLFPGFNTSRATMFVDEIRYFARALTVNQIAGFTNAQTSFTTQSIPLRQWDFESNPNSSTFGWQSASGSNLATATSTNFEYIDLLHYNTTTNGYETLKGLVTSTTFSIIIVFQLPVFLLTQQYQMLNIILPNATSLVLTITDGSSNRTFSLEQSFQTPGTNKFPSICISNSINTEHILTFVVDPVNGFSLGVDNQTFSTLPVSTIPLGTNGSFTQFLVAFANLTNVINVNRIMFYDIVITNAIFNQVVFQRTYQTLKPIPLPSYEWTFDAQTNCSGFNWAAGNGAHTGLALINAASQLGQEIDFINATNTCENTGLNVTSFLSYSIEFWLYRTLQNTGNNNVVMKKTTIKTYLTSWYSGNQNYQEYSWTQNFATTNVVAFNYEIDPVPAFPLNQWYQLVYVNDAENGLATIYVNGSIAVTYYTTDTYNQPFTIFWIGAQSVGVTGFSGLVDSARFWNTPLSAEQVNYNYQNYAGSFNKETTTVLSSSVVSSSGVSLGSSSSYSFSSSSSGNATNSSSISYSSSSSGNATNVSSISYSSSSRVNTSSSSSITSNPISSSSSSNNSGSIVSSSAIPSSSISLSSSSSSGNVSSLSSSSSSGNVSSVSSSSSSNYSSTSSSSTGSSSHISSVCIVAEIELIAIYIFGSEANLTEFKYEFIQDISIAAGVSNNTVFIISVVDYDGWVLVTFSLNSTNASYTALQELAYLESLVNITDSLLRTGTVTYAMDRYVGLVYPDYFYSHPPGSVAASNSDWWQTNGLNYWLVIGFAIFVGVVIILLIFFLCWWATLPATAAYSTV